MSGERFDDERPEDDRSDMRRRAAWLLGMLALVAALFVTLMVVFFNSSGGGKHHVDNLAVPTGVAPSASGSPSTTGSNGTGPTEAIGSGSSGSAPGSSGSSASSKSSDHPHQASCPDMKPCALDDDIGDAVAAINDYRQKNGKESVPGEVSAQAKECALNNGNGCTGGWAETQVPKADGKTAVQKILQFGKLLSPMKSVEVGWAYDPQAKQYYFALIRND